MTVRVLTRTGNARLAGLEKDLKLVGYDYNLVLSIFYISYVVFEVPATLLCKIMGEHLHAPFPRTRC